MNFMQAMDIVEEGFRVWREKPHNAKWWKRIDGTPIPNDLSVNIAEAICRVQDARIEALEAALRRIDAINDSPARFSKNIHDVCCAALAPE